MPRKHLFPLVVLLAAAVVAGLLAVSRTVQLGQPTHAATASDPTIAFRLRRLDRFERSLRQQLANAPAQQPTTTVFRRAPSTAPVSSHAFEHEDGSEGGDRDD